MTTVGKLLVFANLILGVGAATVGVTLYSQRPGWFDAPADGGADRGQYPLSFKGLAADVDAAAKASAAASANWGAEYRRLLDAERTRAARQVKLFGKTAADGTRTPGLIDFAKEGDPRAGGAGFFNFKTDPRTKLYDLDVDAKAAAAKGKDAVVVVGPDGLPLRGADTLLDRFKKDSLAITDLANQSKKLRLEGRDLGVKVAAEELKVLAQRLIRQNLADEAAYLDDRRVNAAALQDTVARRRAQLRQQLDRLRLPD